uniref:Uncharacterized protein LOC111135083 isoform X9 n=1 Tax=Crassostrea virginica TaxID=6565 RepID=A0A8B8ELA6_CRAVI|nr:uncharacterized protein LOC111135083 isoform X9 [Crassostrea virginica]
MTLSTDIFGSNEGKFSSQCSKETTFCPSGHYFEACDKENEARCVQCDSKSYQPDRNGPMDKCKTKTQCDRPNMGYADRGSTVRDAKCRCNPGFHFRKGDHTLCIPNRECPIGYGQTDYGDCENCHQRNMYSDQPDKIQRCQVLRNCEKENRCTKLRSDGTFNNVCDKYPTKDISNCTDPRPMANSHKALTSNGAAPLYAGAAVGAIFFLVVIFFLVMFLLWKRRRAQSKEDALSRDQIESLLERIVTRSEGDEPYSRKGNNVIGLAEIKNEFFNFVISVFLVIAAAFREIEDRIDRQIWKLPQELFREHMQPAMYEVIVEKYKDKDHKYAINGYLQDWREWKGENSEAISHLFKCLRLVEREDIVYEICNKFREGYPEVVMDAEVKLDNGIVKKNSHQITFKEYLKETLCCCCSSKRKKYAEKGEPMETQDSLLSPQEVKAKEAEAEVVDKEKLDEPDDVAPLSPSEAGAIYRERPSPSAPVIDDAGNVHVIIPMNRAYSFPVQASS